ncbi:MAG: VapC toxin family PIN domain ribonuclease, partial [Cyanobacteria bacterium J06649_4]
MNDLFVDTSGWANFFISSESHHRQAMQHVLEAKRHRQLLITTNYVIAELVALLGSRYPIPRTLLFQHINAIKTLSSVRVVHIDRKADA